jgi:hypothetical protein
MTSSISKIHNDMYWIFYGTEIKYNTIQYQMLILDHYYTPFTYSTSHLKILITVGMATDYCC